MPVKLHLFPDNLKIDNVPYNVYTVDIDELSDEIVEYIETRNTCDNRDKVKTFFSESRMMFLKVSNVAGFYAIAQYKVYN